MAWVDIAVSHLSGVGNDHYRHAAELAITQLHILLIETPAETFEEWCAAVSTAGVGDRVYEMTENGNTHRERLAVLRRDPCCTECNSGHRSVSVITDVKGARGVCGRCHVVLTSPDIVRNRWGMPATWIDPD